MACSRPRWHVDCSLGHSALIAFRNDPKGYPDIMWVTCTLTRAREVGAGEIHEKMPKCIEKYWKILIFHWFSLIFQWFWVKISHFLHFAPNPAGRRARGRVARGKARRSRAETKERAGDIPEWSRLQLERIWKI